MSRLSKIVEEQVKHPSPIRQIMKMAERQNIINMGLNPDEVISFGGGWVNHQAPEELRNTYVQLCSDPKSFHVSGGYSATLGDMECRELIARMEEKLFRMKDIDFNNILIGQSSTQITHDMFVTLANPGDTILLFDPTYANYPGQIAYTLPRAKIVTLQVLDTEDWTYLKKMDEILENFKTLYSKRKPRIVMFSSPDNPTSQIPPTEFVKAVLDIVSKETFVVIDFAYKVQHFIPQPEYFAWSPNSYPNLVGLHSNSKWGRGLGRRLGWMEASREIIDGMERTQQCTILCPDSLHQMAMKRYLRVALDNNSMRNYLDKAREDYRKAAKVTLDAIDKYLGFRRLEPQGGLYTVMDVERDGNDFVLDVLKHTGVLFIPGAGFGKSLRKAVRISYGPMVNDQDKIGEGMERVEEYLG